MILTKEGEWNNFEIHDKNTEYPEFYTEVQRFVNFIPQKFPEYLRCLSQLSPMTEPRESINLNKFISDTGITSRRGAEKFITEGRVTINGAVAKLGNRVNEGDEVLLDGKPLRAKPTPVYLALNKPVGITCTTEQHIKDNIVDFVNYKERLFPVGRLDKDSEGLIFLTNDGNIVNKILRAGNNHEKEYVVRVDKPINAEFIKQMANGIPILGGVTKKCKVWSIDQFTFGIILTQGLNRQIRRMCDYLQYEVKALKRIRIMNIPLGNLKTGQWRLLTDQEMKMIHNLVSDSVKTQEASDAGKFRRR